MPRVRVSINAGATDDWLATLSTEFPETEFRLLASHPTDDGLLGVLELRGPDAEAVVGRFEDASAVRSFDVLHSDDESVLLRATTPVPEGYRANRASGTPPNFPARMQDGWVHTELTASHERLSQFTEALAAAAIPYRIESLTQSHESAELLTDRQREFVTEAVARGYYESPRGCTLTELAAAFDVNKSAASGILHRAEGRIVERFVDGLEE